MKIKKVIVGELFTNCYLFYSKGELVVIDPGGEPEKILKEISKTKANPKYIINTHNHFDHILANEEVKKETGAKILENLKENYKIKVGDTILEVIETPGHTKESICLIGDGFIFTGDTVFKNGYGRTDLEGGSEEELINSLKKLSKIIKKGTKAYPGHGELFTFG